MHILILPSWYPSNANDIRGVFFRDQAIALHNYGHTVGVIAPSMRSLRTLGKARSHVPDCENDRGILTYREEVLSFLPRIPYGSYLLFLISARKLLNNYIRKNGKPDIIHAHSAILAGAAGVKLSQEFEIPLVLTEHSTGFARGIYAKWQLKLAESAIKKSGLNIAVSPSLANILIEKFPSSNGRWKWIPNVVAERFSAKKRSCENNHIIRYLNLALMTEKKGQIDLLSAFIELNKNSQTILELWLAGDGPIKAELMKKAKEAGVSDRVHFLGKIEPEKVPKLLAKVDVMVVSSHYETFGVVAAEALMAGVPVVATRSGGPECIVEEGDGLLVEPKQPKALATAMLEIGQNLDRYEPTVLEKNAQARFSSSAVAAQLTTEYQTLLSVIRESN